MYLVYTYVFLDLVYIPGIYLVYTKINLKVCNSGEYTTYMYAEVFRIYQA